MQRETAIVKREKAPVPNAEAAKQTAPAMADDAKISQVATRGEDRPSTRPQAPSSVAMGTPTRRPSTTRPRSGEGMTKEGAKAPAMSMKAHVASAASLSKNAIGGLREANHGQKRGEGAQKRTKQVCSLKDERSEGQSFVGAHVEQGEDEALVARKARDTAG